MALLKGLGLWKMRGAESWGKEKIIRIALIDLLFASCLLLVHGGFLISHGSELDLPLAGMSISPKRVQAVSILFWVSIFALNILQIILSFNLFSALKEEVPEPVVFINVSQSWCQFSIFVSILLVIKVLLVLFGGFFEGRFISSIIFALVELTFKIIGILLIKKFVQRIRSIFVPSSLATNVPILFIALPAAQQQQQQQMA